MYQVAKSLGLKGKELISKLDALGFSGITSVQNTLTADQVEEIRQKLEGAAPSQVTNTPTKAAAEAEDAQVGSESDLVERMSRYLSRPPAGAMAHRKARKPQREERRSGPPREARSNDSPRAPERRSDDRPRERESTAPGGERPAKARVKVFHPDVVPGGGYIEMEVDANAIPPGALVVSPKAPPASPRRPAPTPEPRAPRDGNQLAGMPPAGGILAAGRSLRERGIEINASPQAAGMSSRQVTPAAPSPTAPTTASPTPSTSPTATGMSSRSIQGSPPVSGPDTQASKAPAGIGSQFMQGLPGSRLSTQAGSAKKALDAAFSGLQAPGASSAKVPPSAPKAPPKPSPVPPARKERVVIDGRLIEAPGQERQQHEMAFSTVRSLYSPEPELQTFSLQLNTGQKLPLDAHLLLWPEGHFSIHSRVNDTDPRPRVWAEEGLTGLGLEQRLQELQRWSIWEWWDALEQKMLPPMAAFAASTAVRDSEQVSFVYDPDYAYYRLYQRAQEPLKGEYPMLMCADGKLSFSFVSLDGVQEKERITPDRMQAILGAHAPKGHLSVALTAIPALQDKEPVDLKSPKILSLFRDQLSTMFRFPELQLPDPLGGTGMLRLKLGLWEMSQDSSHAHTLRQQAVEEKPVILQASAGNVSDLVRRELWRMGEKIAQQWSGYNPKEIAEAIRVALREDHYNMQGFQPKKPGDYRYDPSTGQFEIVLKRYPLTHTLLLQGDQDDEPVLGALVLYNKQKREGLDPFEDYGRLLTAETWQSVHPTLRWHNAWLLAPQHESRCTWADIDGNPATPLLRNMPDWHRGVAQALFLTPQ